MKGEAINYTLRKFRFFAPIHFPKGGKLQLVLHEMIVFCQFLISHIRMIPPYTVIW